MKKLSHILLAAAGFCAAFSAGPSFAQDSYKDSDEIIVVAPRSIGRDATRVSHFVSYKDLDLRYAGDVNILRHRISETAAYGCSQLREAGNRDCINDAVRNSQPQVREAVYYARHY